MKRRLVFLVLVALTIGCDWRTPRLRGAQELSTAPTTWRGNPGTAVTIRFATDTELLKGVGMVAFRFAHSNPNGLGKEQGEFWSVADFIVPVLKLEPRAVTLFFANDEPDSMVLSQLPEQIEAGTLAVIPCIPDRIC